MRVLLASALAMGGLAACQPAEQEAPRVRLSVPAAPAITRPAEAEEEVVELSQAAQDKIMAIREVLARNSLTRLVRLANAEPAFVSNFAGESHRVQWDLLRRTGFDPLARLQDLLDGPYGTRQVGEETWYIWPDLAALDPELLRPERLSFRDRARLRELVGDEGLSKIAEGQGYPGVRTAIAEDGRWLYFVHESEDETQEPE
ncbi:hypothetical protein RYZ27_10615 [Hyphomonas sp. FCG-A18]|uniref:hypothetical protein n=1 Tax=Hyphomonas sp. FCG-A18 TaxID=3080019 RepID=UPI002B2F323D|nr:hypothetical protein RYZ27_10615 [Hyphomonas sp. FCG-A18]